MAEQAAKRRVPRQPKERLEFWPMEVLTPKEVSLRAAFAGTDSSDYLSRTGREGRLLKLASERLAVLSGYGKPGELDGQAGPPAEFLAQLRGRGISASALESFARCPFQFFAGRVLGLGEEDEASEKGEFAAWARGKIYHAVLERFYSSRGESFWRGAGAGCEKALEEAIEGVFAEYSWRELGVYPVLWLAAKKTMTARLREFVAWDLGRLKESGLRPSWFEKELEGPLPAKLPEALEGLKLHGFIDRVDLDEQGKRYRIVDYKTRWRKKKPASLVAKGEMHQLPIYAELAGKALGGAAEFLGASLYMLEDSPETTGAERAQSYEGEDWRRDRKAFFERVALELEEIAQGRYPIRPEDGEFGYCRWCDFSAMCRKNHAPTRRRAAGKG
jgi:ATP-dependent helicase/nuclease subunit B